MSTGGWDHPDGSPCTLKHTWLHCSLKDVIGDEVDHADVDHGEAGLEEGGHCLQGAALGNGRIQSLYSTHLREWYVQ